MKSYTKKQNRKFIIEQLIKIADDEKIDVGVRATAFGMLARIFGIPSEHSGVRARVENGQASPIRGAIRERVEGGSDEIRRVPCRD